VSFFSKHLKLVTLSTSKTVCLLLLILGLAQDFWRGCRLLFPTSSH
jgi:hypothetical protein